MSVKGPGRVGVDGLALLEPWHSVSPERRAQLDAEVARELPRGHVLAGRPLAAAAARSDCDDVLFEVPRLGYAVVHLTWSGRRENSPEWPRTEVFSSIEEWRDRVMQRDHEESVDDTPKLIEGTFIQEPRGAVYRGLVAALGSMAHRVLLVEREWATDEGRRLCLQLEPWCASASARSAWPGTQYFGSDVAVVREYAPSNKVIAALQTTVGGLYEWQGGLPEDLAFLREDGEPMVYAISHESDGALTLHPAERDRLLRQCPGISACIEWRRSGSP